MNETVSLGGQMTELSHGLTHFSQVVCLGTALPVDHWWVGYCKAIYQTATAWKLMPLSVSTLHALNGVRLVQLLKRLI